MSDISVEQHHAFAPDVYAARLAAAARAAATAGLAGLIVGTGADMAYLAGTWISTHERLTALVIPADGSTPLIVCPAVDVGDIATCPAPDAGIDVRGWVDGENPYQLCLDVLGEHRVTADTPVGLGQSLTADHVLTFQGLIGGPVAATVLATSVLRELTMIKDAAEIDALRAAGAAIDRVHAKVPALLRAGRTEADVAADIDQLIRDEGHTGVDFVIVGSGPNGANPHHDYSNRVLEKGDTVVIDIGGSFGPGYRSDCTRTYTVDGADADDKTLAYYEVLEQAQRAACSIIRPGVTAGEVDAAARDIITAAGYGDYFVHRTGHGIGLSTHEEPFITSGSTEILREGMAFSVEPGIYLPGHTGARIEDIVIVTADGYETVNNRPRTLNP